MIRIAAYIILVCLLSLKPIGAQESLEEMNAAMNAVGEGKLLKGISLLESIDAKQGQVARELLGQLYPFVGEYDKAKALRPTAGFKNKATLPADYELFDAVDAIVSEAKERQIVIINESHDAPEHRNFISVVVSRLREIGFTHYAFETLAEDPMNLQARGYAVTATRLYSQEPQFGELIRDAMRIGLVPVSYEMEEGEPQDDPIDDINMREAAQCQNLVNRVLAKNPEVRVLIHVGLDHAIEKPKKWGDKEILWFAARLKKLTGIDPLTIDQITSLSDGTPEFKLPMVAMNSQKKFFVGGPFRGYVDVQVFHPPSPKINGRPAWLATDVRRKMVEVPFEFETNEARLLVLARYKSESRDAIPADQILITPGVLRPRLSLRPGSYTVEVQNEDAESLKSIAITVD